MELEPGLVLTAPPDVDTGHPTRVYVLLSDPRAPLVQLCPAGEDADGELIETAPGNGPPGMRNAPQRDCPPRRPKPSRTRLFSHGLRTARRCDGLSTATPEENAGDGH